MLQETVRQFSRQELATKIEKLDDEEGFNRESFFKMGELGLLGITVPEEHGGTGLDCVSATIAMEEMGGRC
jgi:alkylation response protein AidB-like acyl-CoA dehydrogenase